MTPYKFLAALAALLAVLYLSGCIIARDDGPYRYDRGDRVAADGRRDVGWCYAHQDNVNCRVVER